MSKRRHNFTDSQKAKIHERYGWVCAACGHDWPDLMEADHWRSGDPNDPGVTLCYNCNRIKGDVYIPERNRLKPRQPLNVENRHIWKEQIDANREDWAAFVNKFRGAKQWRIDGREWDHFKAAY